MTISPTEFIPPILILDSIKKKIINYGLDTFTKHFSNKLTEPAFDKILNNVGCQLQKEFGVELLGNDAVNILKKDGIKLELLKVLDFRSDGPDFTIIFNHIDQASLPTNFKDKLIEFLYSELMLSERFKEELRDYFLIYHTSLIPDIQSVLSEIHTLLKGETPKIEVEKNNYSFDKVYINRDYLAWDQESNLKNRFNSDSSFKPISIVDLVHEKKRVLILAEGGFGKSTQFDYLASELSKSNTPLLPVKIKMIDFTGSIEELLDYEFPRWQDVPLEKLILIFDALDEVRSDLIDNAIKKLNLLGSSTKFNRSHIVISCRSNLFQSSKAKIQNNLIGFEVFSLLPITDPSRNQYINERLNQNADDFNFQLNNKGLNELIKSAFYLVHLVDIYEKSINNQLPSNISEIYEKVISNALEADFSKLFTKGLDSAENELKIRELLEKLAVAMDCFGSNEISFSFFQKIIPNEVFRKNLKSISLLNISESGNGKITFIHNTIKEFLSAKYLSKLSFEQIKYFMFHALKYEKVKDKWLNTLSFLQSTLGKNQVLYDELVNWLINYDLEATIGFEIDKIHIEKRERIFIYIANNHWQKGISLYSNKFTDKRLVEFSGQSSQVLDYILNTIQSPSSYDVLLDALFLLKDFDALYNSAPRVINLLLPIIKNIQSKEELRYNSIEILGKFQLVNDEILQTIIINLDRTQSAQIRSSLYSYLEQTGLSEKYVDYLIEGIYLIKNNIGVSERHHTAEDIKLAACIRTIKNQEDLLKLLDHLIVNPKSIELSHYINLIESLEANLITNFETNPIIYSKILEIIEAFDYIHENRTANAFRKLIAGFDRMFETFKAFFEKYLSNEMKYFRLFPVFIDEKGLEYFITKISNVQPSENQIWRLIASIKEFNPEFYDTAVVKINKAFNNSFQHDHRDNFEEIQKQHFIADLELLSDKNIFLQEIRSVFALNKGEQITIEELWEIRKENDQFNGILRGEIRKFMKDDKIAFLKDIEFHYSNEKQWEWTRIHEYYLIATDKFKNEISATHLDWIRNWCETQLIDFDFSNVYFKEKDDQIYYNEHRNAIATYLITFLMVYDFNYSEKYLLNMLWYARKDHQPNSKQLFDVIAEKVDSEKLKSAILENLKSEKYFRQGVLELHIDYCVKNNLRIILPILINIIKVNEDPFIKNHSIAAFNQLKGDYRELEIFINDFDFSKENHWQRQLVIILLENKSKKTIDKLLLEVKNEDNSDEIRLEIACYLIKIGRVEGIEYVCQWFEKNHFNPHYQFIKEVDFSTISYELASPFIFGMLLAHYKNNVGTDPFYSMIRNIENSLHVYSLHNEDTFQDIIIKLNSIIQDNDTLENIYKINYTINEIERRYYLMASDFTSEAKVLELLQNV